MNHLKLNNAVMKYQETGCNEVFEKLYQTLCKLLDRRKKRDIADGYDRHEIEAIYDDAIWETCISYDSQKGNYYPHLLSRIKSRKIDLLRKKERRAVEIIDRGYFEESTTDENDEANPVVIIEDFHRERLLATDEQAVINLQRKRDQRQLISSLTANCDDFTKKVIELFPSYGTPSSLAKALGVPHSKVCRSLKRLSRNFDVVVHGELRDYLPA